MISDWSKQDVAYGCFLVWALTVVAAVGVWASFTEEEFAGGAGAIVLVFLPVLAGAVIAMLVGVVLSIRLWRHWPLPVISGSTALMIVICSKFDSLSIQRAVPIAYGVGVAAMSGYWFLNLRRRQTPPTASK